MNRSYCQSRFDIRGKELYGRSLVLQLPAHPFRRTVLVGFLAIVLFCANAAASPPENDSDCVEDCASLYDVGTPEYRSCVLGCAAPSQLAVGTGYWRAVPGDADAAPVTIHATRVGGIASAESSPTPLTRDACGVAMGSSRTFRPAGRVPDLVLDAPRALFRRRVPRSIPIACRRPRFEETFTTARRA